MSNEIEKAVLADEEAGQASGGLIYPGSAKKEAAEKQTAGKIRQLSESDLEKISGGAAGGHFVVGCNDCAFSAFFDASSYDAANSAAAAHEQATGHMPFIGWQD